MPPSVDGHRTSGDLARRFAADGEWHANRLGAFMRARDIEPKLREFIALGQSMAPDAYYRARLAKNDWGNSSGRRLNSTTS
jgi:hypothetical protein